MAGDREQWAAKSGGGLGKRFISKEQGVLGKWTATGKGVRAAERNGVTGSSAVGPRWGREKWGGGLEQWYHGGEGEGGRQSRQSRHVTCDKLRFAPQVLFIRDMMEPKKSKGIFSIFSNIGWRRENEPAR